MSDFSLDVLQGYFDDLLTPEPQPQRVHQPPLAEPQFAEPQYTEPQFTEVQVDDLAREKLARLLASRPLAVVTETEPESETAPESQPPSVAVDEPPVAVTESVSEPVVVAEAPGADDGWLDNGRPAWAQQRFDVLLFEVAGLTLAVPLMSLGQIQPLTDELTPLFGQADWFMGLQPTAMGKIRTINTARFVMPERYEERFLDAAKYVISMAGLPWGLAVDAVNQPISLDPDGVKWRGERGKRPWLAGTVKQHMCALLDIPTMGRLLEQAERTQSRTDPLKG